MGRARLLVGVALSATVLAVAGPGAAPAGAANEVPYAGLRSILLAPGGANGNGQSRSMELADVDGDGDLDVQVLTSLGLLETYLGDGGGGAAAAITTPAGTAATDLATGDLDSDGNLDSVVVGSDGIVVLLGTGDGTYGPAAVTDTATGATSVAVGDLDGDGDLDLVVGSATSASSVSAYLGAGDGTFAAPTSQPLASRPRDLTLDDLDGDGDLDISVVGWDTGIPPPAGHLATLLGVGDGTFAARTDGATSGQQVEVSSGDVDEDGHVDLLLANGFGLTVTLRRGVGDGTLGTAEALNMGSGGTVSARLADLDLDGNLDVVATGNDNDRVTMRRGDGAGGFGPPVAWMTGDEPAKVRVGDLDGDGRPDVLALDGAGTRRVTVLLGRDPVGFRATQTGSSASPPIVAAPGDVDDDGDLDLTTVDSSGRIHVRFNDRGTFTSGPLVDSEPAQSAGVVLDVDGDDDLDLIFDSQTGGRLLLHRNDGAGAFGAAELVGVVTSHRGMAAGDLDGDGDGDLVVASSGVAQVAVLLGAGNGTFAAPTTHAVGTSPLDVELADLDGDGALDIITADNVGDSVSVVPGDGDGTFQPAVTTATGDGPRDVAVADVDADGRPDVLTVDSVGGTFSVLRGTGSGLAAAVSRPVGQNAVAFAVGDLDGDGDVDVLVSDDSGGDGAPYTDPSTSWYPGNGLGGFGPVTHQRLWDDQGARMGAADLDGQGGLDLYGSGSLRSARYVTLASEVAPGPAWAPFASWADGVADLHSWMLGRAPTAPETSLWVGRLQAGTHTLGDLAAALRGSSDHTSIVDPTVRLYWAYFLRPPDRTGATYWIAQRRAGLTRFAVSTYFSGSAEFVARYGSLTHRQFVELIYQNILGRPGEASGVDFWTGEIEAGRWSRGRVMVGFADSAEYKAAKADDVDAAVALLLVAGVNPTTATVDALATRLAGGEPLADVLDHVLRSDAVAARAAG